MNWKAITLMVKIVSIMPLVLTSLKHFHPPFTGSK